MLNMVLKNDADSVFMSSYEQGRPTPMLLPKPQTKGDIADAIKLLAEGDSATFKVPVDSAFKRSPKPPTFKGKFVVYDVKVVKVIPKGTQNEQVFQANIEKYLRGQMDAKKNAEPANIKQYIDSKKLNLAKTDSGLYYVVNKPGTGPNVAVGDTALVNYTGSLLNGKVFDSSIKDVAVKAKLPALDRHPFTPMRIIIGARQVFPGFEDGLLLLNKGAKATLVIPSKLAYGPQGSGPIGPFTPMVFDIEIVDILHPKTPAAVPAAPTAAAPVKK